MRTANNKISPVVGMKIVRIAWKIVSGKIHCLIKKRNLRNQGGNKYGL